MNFRPRTKEEPEINLIPFIDVLLVVLIFLMLSTTYSRFTELQVNLPSANSERLRERPGEIIVSVAADGRYAVNRQPIDGRSVEVPKGTTIIQAARRLGTDVPHYCWHPGLSVAGTCRVCLVEVEGMPTLQIACNTQCADNMVVRTASDKAKRGRADVMELLLINHPLDCPICDQAGECKLQEYSFRIGSDRSRFDFPKVHKPKHVRFSDKVMFDAERCILCTRCVRVCDEIEGAHVWDLMGRGANSMMIADLNRPWGESQSCTSCGKCVQVCPTGALAQRGSSVAEMEKQHDFLRWILDGREKNVWEYTDANSN